MNNTLPYFVVDAFTDRAFSGNPAAVCILHEPQSDTWLQQVAAEFNLSETAFLWHLGNNHWKLRWFTPTCEVKLCGHATLASAHVLASELKLEYDEFVFSTLSGDLTAINNGDSITLNFPKIQPQYLSKVYAHEIGLDDIGLTLVDAYQAGEDILIQLGTEAEVANYVPPVEKLLGIAARGLIITARSSNDERDFVSRFFAPRVGVLEDPVTGSAHCSLTAFWSRQLGKYLLRAEQLSQRRGWLDLELRNDRVLLTGKSVTFAKGDMASGLTANKLEDAEQTFA